MTTWEKLISIERNEHYFQQLRSFLAEERSNNVVYPPEDAEMTAFHLTSYEQTKVVIVGQDPYHGEGQAHGLSFSVQEKIPLPPSLRNMFKELKNDIDIDRADRGNLSGWAKQGVLLLNTTLTVRKGEAASHRGKGWEIFTDAMIHAVNEKEKPVIFILWGAHAQQKKNLITGAHHFVIESVHPSPLSAHRGFFGSAPFSQANQALKASGQEPVDWSL